MSKEVKAFSSCGGLITNLTWSSGSPTKSITDDVFGINDMFVSSYLVATGVGETDQQEFIAMDTGNDPETLSKALEDFQISPEQIKAVFLTHAHGDHTGGLGVYTRARVYLSEEEKDYINQQTSEEVDLTPVEVSAFKTLQAGEIMKINDTTIKVVPNPGHTPGSVSYLINNKYLFAGATLNFDVYQKAEHQMYTLNDNHELLKKSNQELAGLIMDNDIKMVFTTHGGYSAQPRLAFSGWM
jgi:glyoxylase-like metal-dependent hydrolase (beta-lactamase superfamily II)